jgi:hypothetical protein
MTRGGLCPRPVDAGRGEPRNRSIQTVLATIASRAGRACNAVTQNGAFFRDLLVDRI